MGCSGNWLNLTPGPEVSVPVSVSNVKLYFFFQQYFMIILTCKSELGIQGQSKVRLLGHLTVFINTIEKDSNFGIDNLRKSAQGCTDLLGTLAQRINNGNQIKTRSVGIKWFNFNLGMLVTMKLDFIPCLGLRPEIQSFELITHFLVPLALLITLTKVKS